MCVIIAKSSSAQHPTTEVIDACWARNPDGAGFAYANVEGGVSIIKGLMTLDALKAALAPLLAIPTSFYVLHFRIGTHGGNTAENTHPFWTTENEVALVHNGVLPMSRETQIMGEGRSDTRSFVEDVVAGFPDGWQHLPAYQHLVEEYMGGGNKMATVDKDGIVLLNAKAWTEDSDTKLRYSNTHWKPTVSVFNQHGPYTGISYSRDNYHRRTPQPPVFGDPLPFKPLDTTASTPPDKSVSKSYRAARGHALQRLGNLVRGEPGASDIIRAARVSIDEYQIIPEELETFADYAYTARTRARIDMTPVPSFADLLVSLGAATLVDAIQATAVLEDVQDRADYTADCAVDLEQEEPAQIHYGEFG